MTQRIAEIAGGLTKAQRADVLASGEVYFWTADGRTARGLERRGLVTADGLKWAWTPLGVEVATYLKEQSDGK